MMIVLPRDESQTPAQQVITHNNQLTILLECYKRGQVSLADLKVAAANIAGALPFYRGAQSDEPGFKNTLQGVEQKYALLQKEITFGNLRRGTLYLGAGVALYLCLILWQTRYAE